MSTLEDSGRAYAELAKGIWRENPVLVALLGLCPALAVTNTAINGLAMGGATLFVLVGSSTLISLMRKWIPKQVRITTFIVVIATFVTIIDMVLQAVAYDIHKELGAFIALIVVNCLILGRQEAFASRNGVGLSIMDALGMSGGFTLTLVMVGAIREIFGEGSIFGYHFMGEHFEPWVIMVMPPGGFLTLGLLLLFFNWLKERRQAARDLTAQESAA